MRNPWLTYIKVPWPFESAGRDTTSTYMQIESSVFRMQGEAVPLAQRAVRADSEEERADVRADHHCARFVPRRAARTRRERHEHSPGKVRIYSSILLPSLCMYAGLDERELKRPLAGNRNGVWSVMINLL